MAVFTRLYSLTGGKVGSRVRGLPVLLLHTVGRKTGRQRNVLLGYFEDGGSYVITASNAGFDTHPAWFHNLRTNPRTTVEIGKQKIDVIASVAGPGERERLWKRLVALAPLYENYEQKTRRTIPLVILHPAQQVRSEGR